MSDDNQTLIRSANKRFGEIISDGFKLFARLWSTLIIPFAFFFIISIMLKIFLFTDIIWQLDILGSSVNTIVENFYSDPNSVSEFELTLMMQYLVFSYGITILQNMIGAINTIFVMASISMYVLKKYHGIESNLIEEFRNGLNKKLLLVILILGILTPLGSILLYIPSIILFGYYIFSIYTIHFDETEKSIKQARKFSKGSFMKIIGTFLLVAFLVAVINFFYQSIIDLIIPYNASWYNPATRNYGMIITSGLVYNLINILATPLFICILTPLFVSLKAKKDLGEIYYTSPELSLSTSESALGSETGLYCPFCGKYMKNKLGYCPHCGEALSF